MLKLTSAHSFFIAIPSKASVRRSRNPLERISGDRRKGEAARAALLVEVEVEGSKEQRTTYEPNRSDRRGQLEVSQGLTEHLVQVQPSSFIEQLVREREVDIEGRLKVLGREREWSRQVREWFDSFLFHGKTVWTKALTLINLSCEGATSWI